MISMVKTRLLPWISNSLNLAITNWSFRRCQTHFISDELRRADGKIKKKTVTPNSPRPNVYLCCCFHGCVPGSLCAWWSMCQCSYVPGGRWPGGLFACHSSDVLSISLSSRSKEEMRPLILASHLSAAISCSQSQSLEVFQISRLARATCAIDLVISSHKWLSAGHS